MSRDTVGPMSTNANPAAQSLHGGRAWPHSPRTNSSLVARNIGGKPVRSETSHHYVRHFRAHSGSGADNPCASRSRCQRAACSRWSSKTPRSFSPGSSSPVLTAQWRSGSCRVHVRDQPVKGGRLQSRDERFDDIPGSPETHRGRSPGPDRFCLCERSIPLSPRGPALSQQ